MKNHSVYDFVEKIMATYVSGIIIIILGICIIIEISARAFINYSLPGIVDIAELSVVLIAFLSLGVTQNDRAHITVDILQEKLRGRRAGFILDCFLLSLNILVMFFVLVEMIYFMFRTYRTGITTTTLFWPVWPFVLFVIIGIFLYIFRMTKQFKQSFLAATTYESTKVKNASKREGE